MTRPYNAPARCGTTSGYNRHQLDGVKPCDACAAAKAAYDQRRRSAPYMVRMTRLRASAQWRALKILKDNHPKEYKLLYGAVLAEAIAREEVTSP